MTKNPDKYTKIKTTEVSARSLFGRPSEMDKTIEKWINQGWTLIDQKNINKSKYLLTFEYQMSEEEIAHQKKSERSVALGCFALIVVGIAIAFMNSSRIAANTSSTQTQRAVSTGTQVAVIRASDTAKSVLASNATASATLWTSTPTFTPSNTSTPTSTPTSTSTPTITPTATDTNTPTATDTATNTFTPTATPIVGVVTGNNINARSCPSQSCEVIRVVTAQEELVILGTSEEWYWVKFADGETAYIFGNLLRIPEGVTVALAPTMTTSPTASATFTPTNTPTSTATQTASNTPRATATRRPTETPFKLDQDLVLDLIRLTVVYNDFEIYSVAMRSGDLIVEAPAILDGYDSELEYRMSLAGILVGAIVSAYEDENVIASPPRNIIIVLKYETITMLRIGFSYTDAVLFRDGDLTVIEFVNRWDVD